MRSKFRTTFAAAAAAAMVLGTAGLAVASDVDVAVVDVTAPVSAVSIEQGQTAPITINATVTGSQAGTATFEVYRDWTLSGGVFTGSNPQEFTVQPRSGGAAADVFSTSGQITVDTAQAAGGTYTLEISAFDITNTNSTGAKLEARNSSNYEVTVLEATASVDTTPPVVTVPSDITTQATGNSQAVVNYVATAVDDVDGPVSVSCTPASGSSFPVGTTTVNCEATDSSGNTGYGSFTVTVTYDFDGFYRPVVNEGANVMKAGAAVPIKFSLNGDQGLDIFAAGFPKSVQGDYVEPGDTENVVSTVTAGSSSLQYDAVTDTYSYVWKTEKGWANSERQFVIKFRDGTPAKKLSFQFKK